MLQIDVRLKGFQELSDKLRQLSKGRAAQVFKAAIQSGAVEMGREIKAHVPVKTGALAKSIKARRMPTGSASEARSIVECNIWYGKMIERGFKIVKTNRYFPGAKKRFRRETPGPARWAKAKRQKIGTVAPRPFMRTGFASGVDRTLTKIGTQLGNAIAREFTRLGK